MLLITVYCCTPMFAKIRNIMSRLKRLNQQDQRERYYLALLEHNLGDTLHFSEPTLEKVRALIKEQFGLEGFSETIHRNDIMFHYHLLQVEGEMLPALFSHYAVGARFLTKVNELLSEIGHKPPKILDFGSGYGRVSRFIPQVWPSSEVWVSEVKTEAMEFQENKLGFKVIKHNQNPESFHAETFDLILALSVFSHLPESSFRGWVDVLIAHLAPGGKLIFSFNALKKPHKRGETFRYLPNSEDLHFPHISNANLDSEEYGHAFISRDLIIAIAESADIELSFLDNRLSPQQETVLISRKA